MFDKGFDLLWKVIGMFFSRNDSDTATRSKHLNSVFLWFTQKLRDSHAADSREPGPARPSPLRL